MKEKKGQTRGYGQRTGIKRGERARGGRNIYLSRGSALMCGHRPGQGDPGTEVDVAQPKKKKKKKKK